MESIFENNNNYSFDYLFYLCRACRGYTMLAGHEYIFAVRARAFNIAPNNRFMAAYAASDISSSRAAVNGDAMRLYTDLTIAFLPAHGKSGGNSAAAWYSSLRVVVACLLYIAYLQYAQRMRGGAQTPAPHQTNNGNDRNVVRVISCCSASSSALRGSDVWRGMPPS